jgi:hypothetical protein
MCDNPKVAVAVVIVNWNKKDNVLNLLSSLNKNLDNNHEIIIVDNASTDGSVEAIKQEFPKIHVIVNSENIGGTGGFNTGMRYALEKGGYKYIWLLDNDAQVENNTLNELIKAMEKDETIGISGSRIVDTERKDITVEAGAFIRRDTIGVKPLFRNKKAIDIKTQIEDVDYVAICSALVRLSALKEVGLMDERFFIFWDDMDWGLQFKKNGYRVVAILNSIAYHPAFTEKRSALMDFYYGNRNSLLTYAKHFALLKRAMIFYSFLRYKCKVLTFLGFNGRRDVMKLGFESIFDFITGQWGKKELRSIPKEEENTSCNFPKETNKVLILNGGSANEIYDALNILKKLFPNATYTLLMTDDRLDIFNKGFEQIVVINTKIQYRLSSLSFIFFKILSNKHDIAVNFKYTSPFSYAAKRVYSFDSSKKQFREDKNNLNNIWKLILSTALGEVIAILLLPIVYTSSLKHGKT